MGSELYEKLVLWDLRYLKETEEGIGDRISEASLDSLTKIVSDFPKVDHQKVFLLEDIVEGNVISNMIIYNLLLENKIKTRAFRINAMTADIDLLPNEIDVLIVDSLDFELIEQVPKSKINLINVLDYQMGRTPLIFINAINFKGNFVKNNFRWMYNQMLSSLNVKIKAAVVQ